MSPDMNPDCANEDGRESIGPDATGRWVCRRCLRRQPWTKEQLAAIEADPMLSQIGPKGLTELLTREERKALQAHLDLLANLRRRVEAEHREDVMP